MIEDMMSTQDIEDKIKDLQAKLKTKHQKIVTKNGKYKYLSELENNMMEEYIPLIDLHGEYLKDENIPKIRLGFIGYKERDEYLVPGINVFAGTTGSGKSVVANNVAYRAVADGKNVLFISLEIAKKLICYQMCSIQAYKQYDENTSITHSKIKKHKLTEDEENKTFNELWNNFNKLDGNLYMLDEWDFDYKSVIAFQEALFLVEEFSISQTGRGIDLIILDYVQLLKEYKELRIQNEYDSISRWTNDLRKMSTNYLGQNRQVTILLISQLNRTALNEETRVAKSFSSKRNSRELQIGLDSIAGSVEIIKAASKVFVIYSDESSVASEQCLIFALKNRDGELNSKGRVVYFNPKNYVFGVYEDFDVSFEGNTNDIMGGLLEENNYLNLNLM